MRGSQFRWNVTSGFAVALGNALLVVATYPVYLRYCGYEELGFWLVIQSFLMFSYFADLGVGHALVRWVAEEQGKRENRQLQQVVVTGLLFLLGAGVFWGLLVAGVGGLLFERLEFFSVHLQGGRGFWAPLLGVLCFLGVFTQGMISVVCGLGRMDVANGIQFLGRLSFSLSSIFFLLRGWGVEAFLMGTFLSTMLIHLLALRSIQKLSSVRPYQWKGVSWDLMIRMVKFGATLFAGSLLGKCLHPFIKWILAGYAGLGAVPIYDLAFRGAMQVRSMLETGFRALMPEVSRIQGQGGKGVDVTRLLNRAMIWIWCLGAPGYLAVGVTLEPLLKFWLGGEYVPELLDTSRFMLIGSFLSLLGVPVYYLAMGLGAARVCVMEHLISAAGTIFLVLGVVWWTGSLSPWIVAVCMAVSFASAMVYMFVCSWQLIAGSKPFSTWSTR